MALKIKTVVIIGGGAAGYMAAITCAEQNSDLRVVILERGKQSLEKVRISGGGRCNVTHACFEPRELVKFYPRGNRELLGAFMRFQPSDTVEWFRKRGVVLKTEADGRMFPQSNTSETIVKCLRHSALDAGVEILHSTKVDNITIPKKQKDNVNFEIKTSSQIFEAYAVMVAAGSSNGVWQLLEHLGYEIEKPVPSLFTFNCNDLRLKDLAGVSLPKVSIKIPNTSLAAEGAFLITHWGISGPAVLRLSAWGARQLADLGYQFNVKVNFVGETTQDVLEFLTDFKTQNPKKKIAPNPQFDLPARLWQRLCAAATISDNLTYADASKKMLLALAEQLTAATFAINGKSTFKEEFVTCGGVQLSQINFKTMESKLHPHLFMAGEILNIDAITGGFNFQAAWTCGYLAGMAMGE